MDRQSETLTLLSRFEAFLFSHLKLQQQQITLLKKESEKQKLDIQELIVQQHLLDERELDDLLHQHYGEQHIYSDHIHVQPDCQVTLPEQYTHQNLVLPLSLDITRRRLEILMPDPDRTQLIDEIALLTGFRVIPRVAQAKQIRTILASQKTSWAANADSALEEAAKTLGTDSGLLQNLEEELAAEDAPIVQLVNTLLVEAVNQNASDVHLESQKDALLVRFRVDGVLRDIKSIPKQVASAVISRIKISSGMDIAERRRPQDGRMTINTPHGMMDMRVNTLAVQYGESVVLRLLKANTTAIGLEKLGLSAEEAATLHRITGMSNGIILVTGPTGSGKTTTLYACLRDVNSRERKIITIEDPIEYPLPGINQTQISHKAGLDFAIALRAIMRQDPDIVMIGEIRDKETLTAAMHAAMTGHLVFSTIHTNNASKTINRLKELGADPAMISSTVVGIIAQRLVRKICKHCKVPYQANPEELKILGFENTTTPITLYKGTGCHRCSHSGYHGRIGLYEIMEISRELQKLIDENASTLQLEEMAVKNGMIRLGMNGERKVASGLTTVEEVTRVLGTNW